MTHVRMRNIPGELLELIILSIEKKRSLL